jgi:DNA polymerase alpha subunit A
MVRRDWCPLTKVACSSVLNALLDLIAAEDAVEIVVKTMADMANAIRGGVTYELPLSTVSKSLTRDPEVYKDANQPHVQVALRMKARNEQVRSGDLLPYWSARSPPAAPWKEKAPRPSPRTSPALRQGRTMSTKGGRIRR